MPNSAEPDPAGISVRAAQARIYRLFAAALELDAALREEFLTRECASDPLLRAEIDALLHIAGEDRSVTGRLLAAPWGHAEDLSGQSCGQFRLSARIGAGGMGVVYRAERTDGVQQTVAIKLLATIVSAAGHARFEREAQLLAQIEHPAVARLVDVGVEGGRPWIAMEFVDGLRIDDYCRERNLAPRAIVQLLVQLTDAVAMAHRMLVIHNDIKPANVLVTADGVPRLIDFGISRVLQETEAASTPGPVTLAAGRLFSPGFAAPEQINGAPLTAATDVFGLGALAYRLLVGHALFPDAVEPLAYMLAIAKRDVELPSRAALNAGHPLQARQLRGDLDAILCKALERDPRRRYAFALDLQEDLQSCLANRPVRARAPTLLYRCGKFVRRHTLPVLLVTLLGVTLVAGATTAELQRRRADQAREAAVRRAQFIESLLAAANPGSDNPNVTVATLLDSAARELDDKLGDDPLAEGSMLGVLANTDATLGRYPQAMAANDRELGLLRAQGGNPAELGRALAARGNLLRELGRWSDALPPLREAVALLRPRHSPVDLCYAMDTLAWVLAHTDQEAAAEAMFHDEIAIEQSGSAALRPQEVQALYGLSVAKLDAGRYDESAAFGLQAVTLARATLPEDHPDRLNVETAYANTLAVLHRSVEAEQQFRQIIAAQTRVLGPEHKSTLLTKLALVSDLADQHRDAEAAELALPVARALDALLTPDNLYALSAWNFYGVAACGSHHEPEGLATLQRVAAGRQRLYPAGSWVLSSTQLGIGSCLYHLHRYREAEAALLPAVSVLETARGPAFNRTQEGYRLLSELYTTLGRTSAAAQWSAKLAR